MGGSRGWSSFPRRSEAAEQACHWLRLRPFCRRGSPCRWGPAVVPGCGLLPGLRLRLGDQGGSICAAKRAKCKTGSSAQVAAPRWAKPSFTRPNDPASHCLCSFDAVGVGVSSDWALAPQSGSPTTDCGPFPPGISNVWGCPLSSQPTRLLNRRQLLPTQRRRLRRIDRIVDLQGAGWRRSAPSTPPDAAAASAPRAPPAADHVPAR